MNNRPNAQGNESFANLLPSQYLTIAFAIQLSYGVPSIIRYVLIISNLLNSPSYKITFYKLFIFDGYMNICAFIFHMCSRLLETGLFPQLIIGFPQGLDLNQLNFNLNNNNII